MKVELTTRDIEVLLNLVNDSCQVRVHTSLEKNDGISLEELSLIIKLENALKNNDIFGKVSLDLDSSDIYH